MLHPYLKLVGHGVIHGSGLIAQGLIREGEIVSQLEPNQPKIPISEVLTWSEEQQEELLHFSYQCSDTHYVSEEGREKFMNHSCDPNTWWGDSDTMIARRDIQPGEEITYDYSMTELAIPFVMACSCGSPNCRGTISNEDYLDAAWQAQYGNHLPQHTLNAITRQIQKVK